MGIVEEQLAPVQVAPKRRGERSRASTSRSVAVSSSRPALGRSWRPKAGQRKRTRKYLLVITAFCLMIVGGLMMAQYALNTHLGKALKESIKQSVQSQSEMDH